MVRPAPALARNSMGAKSPLAAFASFTFLVFATLATFAATTRAALAARAARAALSCRDLMRVSTALRLLLFRGQMCSLLSTLHDLCALSDRCQLSKFGVGSELPANTAC